MSGMPEMPPFAQVAEKWASIQRSVELSYVRAKPPQNPNFQMLQMLFMACVPNCDLNSTSVNTSLDNNHFRSHGWPRPAIDVSAFQASNFNITLSLTTHFFLLAHLH